MLFAVVVVHGSYTIVQVGSGILEKGLKRP